jgi:hypothetical protein
MSYNSHVADFDAVHNSSKKQPTIGWRREFDDKM